MTRKLYVWHAVAASAVMRILVQRVTSASVTVGGDVVGAVAAIAAGGFHPDHIDLGFRPFDQKRQVDAQGVRILRARPHPDRALLIIRDGT